MKSKHLLLTVSLFLLFDLVNAQNPEFLMDNVYNLTVSNGELFLNGRDPITENNTLWVSDGTATGFKLLKELTVMSGIIECNGLNYFVTKDDEYNAELWTTDGTATGTTLVKKLKPAKATEVTILCAFNNKIYFIGNDAEHGRELWVSDGTENGTKLFKDINPGVENGMKYSFAIVYKNKMFFNGDSGSNNELWVSDGTEAGTKLFNDINPARSTDFFRPSIVGDKMYFNAFTKKEGYELWVSDGTAKGTHLIKDIAPNNKNSIIGKAIEFNGKAYFIVDRSWKATQLWSTDGTEAGTTMVEDSVTGFDIAVFNGELYFGKIVGENVVSHNVDLYKTKGKPDEGSLLKALSSGNNIYKPEGFVTANGKLYFFCYYGGGGAILNHELWETDGTNAKTKQVEYSPGNLVNVNSLTSYKNVLYFTDYKTLYRIGTPNTAVAEIANNNFEMKLYPNPTTEQLTIKTDSKLIGSNYSVLNIMGQTVRSGKVISDNTLLEVGGLPSGIYLVKIHSKDGRSVSRFVKE
jgi:ELWxxDGT repeat protein